MQALLFVDDERPAQLIDVSTGAVLGSFAPGEGFACPRVERNGTAAQRNDGTAEEQTGTTERGKEATAARRINGTAEMQTGRAERRKEGTAEPRNRLWAFSGGHVVVQIAHRLGGRDEREKEGGEGSETQSDGTTTGK